MWVVPGPCRDYCSLRTLPPAPAPAVVRRKRTTEPDGYPWMRGEDTARPYPFEVAGHVVPEAAHSHVGWDGNGSAVTVDDEAPPGSLLARLTWNAPHLRALLGMDSK